MTYPFQQPDWVQESGKPYPGAENFAEAFQKNMEFANDKALAKSEARKVRIRKQGEEIAKEEEAALRRAITRPLSSYTPGNPDWLWEDRIPIGEITMLAGKAGIGKSTVLATFASWLTVGEMRGAYYGNPQHVLYVPNEDSVEKALLPRLMAAEKGVDLDRIHTLAVTNTANEEDTCPLILPEDCQRMAMAARDTGAVAVFLDPLSSNMSDKDRNRPEVRQSYERLRRCAEDNSLAIIGNGHVRKGGVDANSGMLDQILGSSEIGNIVRAGLGIIVDPDSEERQMVLSQIKNNYGPYPMRSYVYTIKPKRMWTMSGEILGTYIDWLPSTDRQVNDMVAEPNVGTSKSSVIDCAEWMRDYLASKGGEAPRGEVLAMGAKEGFSRPTMDRTAKTRLKVESFSIGVGAARVWRLPRN